MRLWTIKYPNIRIVNAGISLFVSRSVTLRKLSKQSHEVGKEKISGFTSTIFPFNTSVLTLKKNTLLSFHRLLIFVVYSKTAFRESVFYFVVSGSYCYLDLSMTFRKLSSNLN